MLQESAISLLPYAGRRKLREGVVTSEVEMLMLSAQGIVTFPFPMSLFPNSHSQNVVRRSRLMSSFALPLLSTMELQICKGRL
jgi:hypothetical protein